jgi:hypothetical protein
MRVTRQLMHGVIATTLLVGVVNGTLRVMREQRTMADDTQRDHAFVGRTLRSAYAAFPMSRCACGKTGRASRTTVSAPSSKRRAS